MEVMPYQIRTRTSSKAKTPKQAKPTSNDKPKKDPAIKPTVSSGGSYGGNDYNLPTSTKNKWQETSLQDFARSQGITNYDYASILKLYNDATHAKFNELDTQMKRAQAENLRGNQAIYEDYLNQRRMASANAIEGGMTKGTNAALQLAEMQLRNSNISETQQLYNDTLFDLMDQRGVAISQNQILANQEANALMQALIAQKAAYEANDVNALAAQLAAQAQMRSHGISANAQMYATDAQRLAIDKAFGENAWANLVYGATNSNMDYNNAQIQSILAQLKKK